VLVAHLPPDSATRQAIHGETWSRTDQLLAAVFDAVRVLIWQNEPKGTRRPEPLERPGVTGPRRGTPLPIEEVRRLLPGIARADDTTGPGERHSGTDAVDPAPTGEVTGGG
jgi:hypothetical protein